LWTLVHNNVLQHHPFQSVTLSLFVYFMQNIWSFNFFPIWATTWLSWALSFLINFLSFMMFQVYWTSWKFELSKVCEIWVRCKLCASSLSWCLFLDFLALHISHVPLLLGFMILKPHAFSPLWCSSFDFLALCTLFSCSSSCWFYDLHDLHLLFVAYRYVGKSNTAPQTWSLSSSSWFFTGLKEFWPPPLVFCKSTQVFDFLPSCL